MKNKSVNSNRNFGLIFSIVFFVIAFWSFRGDFEEIKIFPLFFSSVFLILGLFNSKLLTPLNKLWIKFGELLGRIIAPIVMGLIYFIVITPIGLFIRFIRKDLLKTKFSKANSYWIKRDKNIGSMKRQF